MDLYSCAIVSHRPTRFKWKYKEKNNGCKRLKKRLEDQITALYKRGIRRFLTGGTLGVDMWSSEILLRLKKQPEYSDIELVIALPYTGHDTYWDERSKARMAFLLKYCVESVTVASSSGPESYHKKDRYLVDHADCLLAVYDNAGTIQSSVGYAVRYAEKKRIPVILIHPDTLAISSQF